MMTVSLISASDVMTNLYKKLSIPIDDFKSLDPPMVFTRQSVIQCSLLCENDPACNTFKHEEPNVSCLLGTIAPTLNKGGIAVDVWITSEVGDDYISTKTATQDPCGEPKHMTGDIFVLA